MSEDISPRQNPKEELIKNFLQQFLPPSEENRKYTHNEFLFLHETIAKLFLTFAKTQVREEELIDCLIALKYKFMVGKTGGRRQPSGNRKKSTRDPVTQDLYEGIYINVSCAAVLIFVNILKNHSSFRNPHTIQQRSFLKEELTLFLMHHNSRGKV